MITLQCDRCEKTIEVSEDMAGEKISCPACGDVNRVPSLEREGADSTESSAERTVMRVRPVMWRARPFVFAGIALLGVLGFGGAIYFGAMRGNAALGWISGIAMVTSLVLLAGWKIRTLAASLEVTTRRTIQSKGLISRATSEVLHENVRNLQIKQGVLDRVLRVGDIGIASAGHDAIEIEMSDLPDPQGIGKVIDQYREL